MSSFTTSVDCVNRNVHHINSYVDIYFINYLNYSNKIVIIFYSFISTANSTWHARRISYNIIKTNCVLTNVIIKWPNVMHEIDVRILTTYHTVSQSLITIFLDNPGRGVPCKHENGNRVCHEFIGCHTMWVQLRRSIIDYSSPLVKRFCYLIYNTCDRKKVFWQGCVVRVLFTLLIVSSTETAACAYLIGVVNRAHLSLYLIAECRVQQV